MEIQFNINSDLNSEEDSEDFEGYLKKVKADLVCPHCGNDFIKYGIEARVWLSPKGNIKLIQVLDDSKPWTDCIGCGKMITGNKALDD